MENWKRDAAAGAFQESDVLRSRPPAPFKARCLKEQLLMNETARPRQKMSIFVKNRREMARKSHSDVKNVAQTRQINNRDVWCNCQSVIFTTLAIVARDWRSPETPELLLRPVLRVATGLGLPWQWSGMGVTIRGVMARIFLIERSVIYAAPQQSSIVPPRSVPKGPILLIFWAFFAKNCHSRCLAVRNLHRTCPSPHRTTVTVAHSSICTTQQRHHTPTGKRNRRGTVTLSPIPIR